MDSRLAANGSRIALVVLLGVLVALAGCTSGGNGDDTTTAVETPTEMETPTTEPGPGPGETTSETKTTVTTTDEPTTTTTTTDEPTTTQPPSGDPIGVVHRDQLQAAGSFTTTLEIEFNSVEGANESTLLVDRTALVDVDGPGYQNLTVQIRSVQEVGDSTRQVDGSSTDLTYTAGGETVRRTTSTFLSSARYAYGVEPYNGSDPSPVTTTGVDGRSLFSEQRVDWQRQGETSFNGETVTEYTVETVDDIPEFDQWIGASFETVDEVNATLLVNGDGVVRLMTMSVSGETTSGATSSMSIELTVSDVGATTVPQPDWFDTAKNDS